MFYLTKCEFLIFSGLYGLIFGSFVNVLIYRIPKTILYEYELTGIEYFGEKIKRKLFSSIRSPTIIKKIKLINRQISKTRKYTLFYPPSSCPKCGAAIKFFDNIPILSYLILKGKCRRCSSPIGMTYLLVELISTLGSIMIAFLIISEFEFANAEIIIKLIFINAFFLLSMALFVIDCRLKILPDSLTFPVGFLGLIFCTTGASYIGTSEAILGGLVGFLVLWTVFWGYKICTKKEGLGRGDIKLIAGLGAWVGLSNIINVLLLASIIGLFVSTILVLLNRHTYSQTIAYGPFLILAAFAIIFKEFLV